MSDLFRSLQTALADRYQLERELGHGGMATVYLARDLKHPRRVALKVLRPELAGVLARERFLREIRISAKFSHPHILPLLDSGTLPASAGFPDLPFYTMPFIEGESLRDRLVRDRQLPLEDALGIAQEVAAALAYAHAHGVVHRDVKPENILLSAGHAVVADFGIARAIQEAVDPEALTSAGLVVGTPAYMSPEQAAGETSLDGRSDLYSLGCVVYEMLVGDPPYTGSSPQAVMARHRLDPVPSLRVVRSTVPLSVEQAVKRALQKSPADRFRSPDQFAEALHERYFSQTSGGADPTARRFAGRRLVIGSVLAVVAGAAWYFGIGSAARPGRESSRAALDTTRYAILAFIEDSGVPAGLQPSLQLQDAMARWSGIALADPFQIRDILSRQDTSGFKESDWRRLAAGLGAGRYARGRATRVGDSVRVHAVLYDAAAPDGSPILHEHAVRIPLNLVGAESAFEELADGLLLRNNGPDDHQSAGGTRSLPARQAYEQGSAAINDWELARADSNFSRAVRHDPDYAQAYLWLALVRSWSDPGAPSAWRSAAERAAAGRLQLSGRDRQMSDAMLAVSRGDLAAACSTWTKLTRDFPYDFVVWYGLAQCLDNDRLVLRDPRSPTGWRFRSSFHRALAAYQQAYALLPSILQTYREESYSTMIHLLMASGTDLRRGYGPPPSSEMFLAPPSWAGDTLTLYPMPAAQMTGSGDPEAIRHQRQRVYEIARAWVSADPRSADALQALAVSLQLLGDRSALDTLVQARRMASDPASRIRAATSEIWMRVLFGAPDAFWELRAARKLADSLLSSLSPATAPEPKLLASIAALTGRAHLAVALGKKVPSNKGWDTPPVLVGLGITFQTYAAMGGPGDSLRALDAKVSGALERDVGPADRAEARSTWLVLPVTMAFPEIQLPSVSALADGTSPLIDADAAFLRGDTASARAQLRKLRMSVARSSPADFTVDQLYPQAWLAAALEGPDSAAATLNPTLDVLDRSPPSLYTEAFRAGTLVRAMAFRAELAAGMGDQAAAREWAAAVVVLWSDADDFLQPLVKRMEALAR